MTLDLDTTVPTLDPERTDQLRTFLTVQAAADAAAVRPMSGDGRRRLIGGVAAASVLAAGLVVANGVVGGPGPAAVDPAVAIEQSDGWTNISILNPDASPAEIEAALEAAGVEARVVTAEDQAPFSAVPGNSTVRAYGLGLSTDGSTTDDGHRSTYRVSTFDAAESGDLTALGVDFDLPKDFEFPDQGTVSNDPADGSSAGDHRNLDALDAAMADLGLKVGGDLPDDTVSIRDGADVEILLYAKA